MFHHETADAERFEQVVLAAVRRIIEDPSAPRFRAWATLAIPRMLGMYDYDLDELEVRRLAQSLATAIWNATPQPGQGFRVQPLPVPPAEALCPCGSGARYGDCCGDVDEVPRLSSDLIWELLLDELPEPVIKDALAVDAIPRPLLARLAHRWLVQDRPGRAVALLEPVFAGPLEDLDADFEPAVDVLCDAYDRLDHWRKKQAFLERLCAQGSRRLQTAAWQRRASIHLDEGDYAQARQAFAAALHSDPDDPANALLEITLLAAEHRDDLARARARFWLHRLRRAGLHEHPIIDFLTQAVADPQRALVDSHADSLDPLLLDLQAWVAAAAARPLPAYTLVPVQPPVPLTPSGAGGRRAVPRRPTHVPGTPAQLQAPAPARRVEALWRTQFPGAKPNRTALTPDDDGRVWEAAEWTDALRAYPEAADSLDILDDLVTALYEHPESALPWIEQALLRPLVDRAWAIVVQTVPAGSPHHCPWSLEPNRPALRLLFRRYLCQIDEGQPRAAADTLETLLRLNPQDHHGVRAELMNHYLRRGQDAEALALAQRFPDDWLADLAYGEVLALYRLGEQEHARAVLRTALDRLPRIPCYLTRKRIKRPHPTPLGTTPGGEDQAWLYREAMRDVWEAVPGVLRWLKRVAAEQGGRSSVIGCQG
jgi:tetratricopeptide (TPR) repeat protein